MSTTKPKGGKGANQYTGTVNLRHRDGAAEAVLAAVTDPHDDVEEVAWRFHPEFPVWAAAGFDTWEVYRSWTDSGGTLQEAQEWGRVTSLSAFGGQDLEKVVDEVCRRSVDDDTIPNKTVAWVLYIDNSYGSDAWVATDKATIISELCGYAQNAWSNRSEPCPDDPRLAACRYFSDGFDTADFTVIAAREDLIRSGQVDVLVVSHEHGREYVIGDEPELDRWLTGYVTEWWDRELGDVADLPDDPQEAVREYFANVDQEWYEKFPVKVSPSTQRQDGDPQS